MSIALRDISLRLEAERRYLTTQFTCMDKYLSKRYSLMLKMNMLMFLTNIISIYLC